MKEIRQRDYKDCGVTSMEYIIEYYKGHIPIEKLREDTYTTTQGTTAYHIVETFRKYHFDSYGQKVEFNELNQLILPCIVHLVLENGMEHFAVLCKVKKNEVYLMDPAYGKRKLNQNEFENIWDNIVILAIPGTIIPKINSKKKALSLLLHLIYKEKKYIFFLVLFSLIISLLTIFSGLYVKIIMEYLESSSKIFYKLVICFGGLYFFKILLSYMKNYLKIYLNKNIELDYMYTFLSHLFSLPLEKFLTYHEGEIMTRVEEAKEIKDLFESICITFFLELILSLFSIIVLCNLNFSLSLILVCGMTLYFLLSFLSSKKIYYLVLEAMDIDRLWHENILNNIRMYSSIKHLHNEIFLHDVIENNLCVSIKDNTKIQKWIQIIHTTRESFLEILFFILLTYGLFQLKNNQLLFIDFLAFQSLYLYFISPIKELSDIFPKFYYFKGIFQKMNETMCLNVEKIEHATKIPPLKIEFKNVSYSYTPYQSTFKNITFSIPEKGHIFLAGKSGAGKSTICKIIHADITDYEGEILIHEKNLKDYTLSELRVSVVYLSQNECIVNGTIEENILFGDNKTPLFDSVCKICEMEEIVNKRPSRYNTKIFNESVSGGEKQRIILARTLLKTGSFYIFDECLSEVEEDMEKRIIQKIRKYLADKTLIYISHNDHSSLFDRRITL